LYKLDLEALRLREPVLHERLRDWVLRDGYIGYAIAASKMLKADSLMDSFHLDHALKTFDSLWKEARRI
jgi:hypothetical protein